MKLLHIDSGILGTASVSRQLSAAAVAEWQAQHPHGEVVYRDLAAQPLAHLAGDQLFAADLGRPPAYCRPCPWHRGEFRCARSVCSRLLPL